MLVIFNKTVVNTKFQLTCPLKKTRRGHLSGRTFALLPNSKTTKYQNLKQTEDSIHISSLCDAKCSSL